MMRYFVNGEPYVYTHVCQESEKGQVMNSAEKRDFLVENLLDIYSKCHVQAERYPRPENPRPVELGGKDWSLMPDIVINNFRGWNKRAYYYVIPEGTSFSVDLRQLPSEIQNSYLKVISGSVYCLNKNKEEYYEKGADFVTKFSSKTILPKQENHPLDKILTDEELTTIVAKAWFDYDTTELEKYLDKDFHFLNEFLFDEISSREEYITFLGNMLFAFKRNESILGVKIKFDAQKNKWSVLIKHRDTRNKVVLAGISVHSHNGRITYMRIKKLELSEFDRPTSEGNEVEDIREAFFKTARELYPGKSDEELVKQILSDLDFARRTNIENDQFAKMVAQYPDIATIYAGWIEHFEHGENPHLALLEVSQSVKDLISGRISSEEYLSCKKKVNASKKEVSEEQEEKSRDLVLIELNEGELRHIMMQVEREVAERVKKIWQIETYEKWKDRGLELLNRVTDEIEEERKSYGLWYNECKLEDEELKNIEHGGFSDISGLTELKEQLRSDFIDVLHEPRRAKKLGLTLPNGMLLYGPPGCGKTIFATKFAEEAKCNFILVNCSDIASTYIHGTQQKIAKVFDEAIEKAPSIIFFDEIEAMIPKRGAKGNEHTQTETNEFLTQLNHCGKKGIFVIGATNHPQDIDEAALRSGRLDMKVYFPTPDAETRASLFIHSLKNKELHSKIDVNLLVEKTEGYISADIKKIVELTARKAFRKKLDYITMDMILEVIQSFKPTVTQATIKEHEAIRDKFEGRKKEYNRIGFC